jgi:hypothetical protein
MYKLTYHNGDSCAIASADLIAFSILSTLINDENGDICILINQETGEYIEGSPSYLFQLLTA